MDATTRLFIGTDSGDGHGIKTPGVASELYNFDPLEVIGGEFNKNHSSGHICSPLIRHTNDKGVNRLLDCSCVQKKVGAGEMVAYLNFISTRNKVGA